jgi:hypothetical protein
MQEKKEKLQGMYSSYPAICQYRPSLVVVPRTSTSTTLIFMPIFLLAEAFSLFENTRIGHTIDY